LLSNDLLSNDLLSNDLLSKSRQPVKTARTPRTCVKDKICHQITGGKAGFKYFAREETPGARQRKISSLKLVKIDRDLGQQPGSLALRRAQLLRRADQVSLARDRIERFKIAQVQRFAHLLTQPALHARRVETIRKKGAFHLFTRRQLAD